MNNDCNIENISQLYFLKSIIDAIPDGVIVYDLNKTIVFFNKIAGNFFKKTDYDSKVSTCIDIFYDNNNSCKNCKLEEAIRKKKLVGCEKYFKSIDAHMSCMYSPILDKKGNVIYIVSIIKDITQKKYLSLELMESEEKYRKIVELSLEGIVVTKQGVVSFANEQFSKIMGRDLSEIIGRKLIDFVNVDDFDATLDTITSQLNCNEKYVFDTSLINSKNEYIHVEISSTKILYKGENAVLSMVRNITNMKQELNRAAQLQKHSLHSLIKEFPMREKINLDYVYIPAKTVSGDFFDFHKINNNYLIGVLFDVSGKGVSASLSVSAFSVLFKEASVYLIDPLRISKYLNKQVNQYLTERYVAACIFSIDFLTKEFKIVGCGINNFGYVESEKEKVNYKVVKGPFLGMFDDSIFDECVIDFEKGDKFLLYTDGMDAFMNYIESFSDFKIMLNSKSDMNYSGVKRFIQDDLTLLCLEIK